MRPANVVPPPSEGELQRLFDMSIGMLAVAGFDGHFKLVSPAFERTLGHPLGELVRRPWEHFLHPDDVEPTRAGLSRVATEDVVGHENRYRCADGSYKWISWNARAYPGEGLIYCVATDVTATRTLVASLREREEAFRVVFEHAPVGMALAGPDGAIQRANLAFLRLAGLAAEDLLGRRLTELVPEGEAARTEHLREKLVAGTVPSFELELALGAGGPEATQVLLHVGAVRDEAGGAVQLVAQLTDITERKKAEERLQHAAVHDALTGLPNGFFFRRRLAEAMARARRTKRPDYAVLFVDLDRFKVINDSLGHTAGDEFLVSLARRLRETVRENDFVARHGGDEFTVLLDAIDEPADIARLAERIHAALAEPVDLVGREVSTTASIGIAPGMLRYESADELLRDADIAMYRAKADGGGRHVIFDAAMHERAMSVLQLETDLRHALQRHELEVFLQPIIALESGHVEGFESLLRWRHPTRGLLTPGAFLQVAEDTGLIRPMGWWLLRKCAEFLKEWDKSHPDRRLWISVNLSNRQFLQPGLVEGISALLAGYELAPQRLRIEITETVAMHDPEQAAALLNQLRALGTPIDIDDFGTGYSSLAHLHRFPIDALKIDRSFVMRMSETSVDVGIVGSIVKLAQSLGIEVTAEGVETADQLARVRALGCTSGQGYFVAPPLPFGEAIRLVEADPAW